MVKINPPALRIFHDIRVILSFFDHLTVNSNLLSHLAVILLIKLHHFWNGQRFAIYVICTFSLTGR
ncbi:hypothetical protein D3C75_1068140 [compost metagenome]